MTEVKFWKVIFGSNFTSHESSVMSYESTVTVTIPVYDFWKFGLQVVSHGAVKTDQDLNQLSGKCLEVMGHRSQAISRGTSVTGHHLQVISQQVLDGHFELFDICY